MIPSNLRYHQEHEWVRAEGAQATVGISHFAQDALGDIVFIEMCIRDSAYGAHRRVERRSGPSAGSKPPPDARRIPRLSRL